MSLNFILIEDGNKEMERKTHELIMTSIMLQLELDYGCITHKILLQSEHISKI